MTIKQALSWGWQQLNKSKIHSAAIDAELLLLEAIKKNQQEERTWLYAHPEFNLTKSQLSKYKKLILRRNLHEPLAYITGHKEFFGLDFHVNKNVLIPRPETETLIENISETIKKDSLDVKQIIFIDIGTGSGCIPITVSKLFKFHKIFASDISEKALRIARLNARKNNETKNISFIKGNLFMPFMNKHGIKNARNLIISANLPYINSKEMKSLPPGIKKFEPALALFGGAEGIELMAKLIEQISLFAKNSAKTEKIILFLEIGTRQKNKIIKKIKKCFKKTQISVVKDINNKERIIKVAIKPQIC